jgi:hypothetical protein
MERWILRTAFAGLALWLLFAAWAQHELGVPSAAPRQMLLLYDADPAAGTELPAIMAANLAGRFGRATIRRIDRYRAGDAARFDATFVLPVRRPPDALLANLRAPRRPAVWIGSSDPQAPRVADVVAVRYKGRDFPRDLRAPPQIALLDASRGEVLATAIAAGGREVPWAVRSGNLLHVAENPFAHAHEDDRHLVFADLLFGLLAPRTPERHRALVRIDNVGPDADPGRVRALADLLAEEGVPFSIAVHARYRDPEGVHSGGRPVRIDLRQRAQLVDALRHAVSRGGTLVAQGFTHQTNQRRNPGRRVSGGDAEYYAADLADGALALRGPLARNGVDHWRARFAAARRAWSAVGLGRPRLFATPLSAASPEAYAAARAEHAARYERTLYAAGAAAGQIQFFPYEIVDVRGDFIVPENLGYPRPGRGPERLIASAARNLAVRDGFASFAFLWHDDPQALRTIVRGIKALGYRFVAPDEVLRDAPGHAAAALRRPSLLAAAAAGWADDLPPLTAPLLAGLLALVFALAAGAERLVARIGRSQPKRLKHAPI